MSSVQLASAMPTVLATEPWDSFWPDAEPLMQQHWLEVNSGIEPRRQYRPDTARFRALSMMGVLLIVTARRAGQLIGYCWATITPDLESTGQVMATQGPWYVVPGAGSNIGYRLFERMLAELRLAGVGALFLHHRLQGRGQHLASFYRRWGAVEYQHEWLLWIGGPDGQH